MVQDRYDRERGGRYDQYSSHDEDRGFFDRAADEVRSWFGDDDAERRRERDERYDQRYERQDRYGRYGHDQRGHGREAYGAQTSYDRANHDRGEGRRYSSGIHGATAYGRQNFDPGWSRQGWSRQSRDRDDEIHGDYRSWRDRQVSQFDRDYNEYRQQQRSRFHGEFDSWRQGRQQQRDLLRQVQEHQEVIGSDGEHLGTVDHVRGDTLKLARKDEGAGGKHHYVPSSWISSVDAKVTLNRTAEEARRQWRAESEDEDYGRTNLNRAFSGTY